MRELPQNLDPGFLSTIFAFRAKSDDDVSMTLAWWDPVRRMTWQDHISRVTSACTEVMWRYGMSDDVVVRWQLRGKGDLAGGRRR